jgi:hypothetical protein
LLLSLRRLFVMDELFVKFLDGLHVEKWWRVWLEKFFNKWSPKS